MKVELLSYTPNPELLVAAAARTCYSKKPGSQIIKKITTKKASKLIKKLVKIGHHSILEHASFTFSIEGVSRACTHQLVRHRIASYSQQSQRYVSLENANFVVPLTIKKDQKAREIFDRIIKEARDAYRKLLELGVPEEDARYVVPQAVQTNIVVTMNARELLHFFKLRCCMRAQWEIRALAWRMLSLVKKVAPTIFENAGPPCISEGMCPEEEFPCKLREMLKRGGKIGNTDKTNNSHNRT